jgi:hypothetical protein
VGDGDDMSAGTHVRAIPSHLLRMAGLLLPLLLGARPALAQDTPTSTERIAQLFFFFFDSVDTQEPGVTNHCVMLGQRRTPNGDQSAWASASGALGIGQRVEARYAVSLPVASGGGDHRGIRIGDSSLSLKMRVRDSGGTRVGLALQPTLEILGQDSLWAKERGPHKYNLALPLIAQRTVWRLPIRSAVGYSTRGAVFAGVGSSASLTRRLGLFANLLYSHATSNSTLSTEWGLPRSRAETGAGVWYCASSHFTLVACFARTVMRMDANATRHMVSAGVCYRFHVWGEH